MFRFLILSLLILAVATEKTSGGCCICHKLDGICSPGCCSQVKETPVYVPEQIASLGCCPCPKNLPLTEQIGSGGCCSCLKAILQDTQVFVKETPISVREQSNGGCCPCHPKGCSAGPTSPRSLAILLLFYDLTRALL